MKTNTLKWINLPAILFAVALAILLIVAIAYTQQVLMKSVGWHELASVGWVT
jgi:hypothetical protein